MNAVQIAIGNFFFKHRNVAFPLILLAAYVAIPPRSTVNGSETFEEWTDFLAISLVAAGLILRGAVLGFHHVKRGGVAKTINAGLLYDDGLFGVCRNPLYVGNILIYTGVFTMHGDWRIIIGGVALFAFIYRCIVSAEEHYLQNTFGQDYADYCAQVPRWAFKLSRLRSSTKHMEFSLKQALLVDYNPVANAVLMLTATQIYEILHTTHSPHRWQLAPLYLLMVAAVMWVLVIRYIKVRAKRILAEQAA